MKTAKIFAVILIVVAAIWFINQCDERKEVSKRNFIIGNDTVEVTNGVVTNSGK